MSDKRCFCKQAPPYCELDTGCMEGRKMHVHRMCKESLDIECDCGSHTGTNDLHYYFCKRCGRVSFCGGPFYHVRKDERHGWVILIPEVDE